MSNPCRNAFGRPLMCRVAPVWACNLIVMVAHHALRSGNSVGRDWHVRRRVRPKPQWAALNRATAADLLASRGAIGAPRSAAGSACPSAEKVRFEGGVRWNQATTLAGALSSRKVKSPHACTCGPSSTREIRTRTWPTPGRYGPAGCGTDRRIRALGSGRPDS